MTTRTGRLMARVMMSVSVLMAGVLVGIVVLASIDCGDVRQVESAFLSPDVDPGGKFIFIFDKAGRYRHQCTYHHPSMNGVVFVEEG